MRLATIAAALLASAALPSAMAAQAAQPSKAAQLAPPVAQPETEARFRALTDRIMAWQMRENPTLASSLGIEAYDDRLYDYSVEAMDRRAVDTERFLAELRTIPDQGLSPATRTNKAILERELIGRLRGNEFGQRLMVFTNRSGWQQSIAGLADGLRFDEEKDYENYLKRLAAYPAQSAQAIAVSNEAIAGGYTLPCAAMEGYETTITGVIGEDPTDSRLYAPFAADRPSFVTEARWAALSAQARDLIDTDLRQAYAEHAEWYRTQYAPNCAQDVGISAQPGGADYYDYRIAEMTTTDLTADEIHRIGLSEVARIRAEMEQVAADAGYATREAFIEELRTNPVYYAKTPEELMEAVAREAKKIDGMMPSLFTVLPRLPYGIKEIPAEIAPGTTTAYYSPGSPANAIAGYYYVNTSKLDQRPLWEVPALTVHEAVPGHHHQIALAQELDMPEWRRNLFFTAFVEGWGLYSERLGIEMGLYDTPAKEMGRLSYEMWRATRLVVDTGIHSKGWSKQRAIDFMTDNTALTEGNIEAEVNRYISWPGQALAYKIGELKIRELRTMAEERLGDGFDLRRFHDAVLGNGAVPLDVLEAQIMTWMESEKARLAG